MVEHQQQQPPPLEKKKNRLADKQERQPLSLEDRSFYKDRPAYQDHPNYAAEGVNISDPEEYGAHLQHERTREKLRQRRRKLLQCMALLACFLVLGVSLTVFGIVSMVNNGGSNDNSGDDDYTSFSKSGSGPSSPSPPSSPSNNNSPSDTNSGSSPSSSGGSASPPTGSPVPPPLTSNGQEGVPEELPSFGNEVPDPPSNLSQICSMSQLDIDPTECAQVCQQSDCCHFPSHMAMSCASSRNQAKCDTYHQSCQHLAGQDDGNENDAPAADEETGGTSTVPDGDDTTAPSLLVDPPDDLADICAASVVETDPTACAAACQPADCCHYPASLALSCYTQEKTKCDAYILNCETLKGSSGGGGGEGRRVLRRGRW